MGSECCEVQLHKDGSWSAHVSKKEEEVTSQPAQESKAKIEVIPDDLGKSLINNYVSQCYFRFDEHFSFSEVIPLSDGSNSSTGPPSKKVALSSEASDSDKPTAKAHVVDLTSDSEDELPLRRKVAKPADSTHVNVESSSSSHIKYNGIMIFHT